MSWHYTLEKIKRLIDYVVAGTVRSERRIERFSVLREGEESGDLLWGRTYEAVSETVTLETTVVIPENWAGQRVYISLQLVAAECLVYLDDVPTQAIDLYHHDLLLAESAEGGRSYKLRIEAFTGSVDSARATEYLGGTRSEFDEITVTLKRASLQWIDRDAEALYFDLQTALSSINSFQAESRERVILQNVLDQTVNILDCRFPAGDERFYESVRGARAYIQSNLYQKYSADPDFTPVMRSVGHAHIDTAWLWPLAHTRKKIARTFTSQLTLLDRFADSGYVFTCSQPQLYSYLKSDEPEIYARIKEAVKTGRWETVGGMWVESDCNVVSGESLVRQFLFGQRFFQAEFGTHNDVLWLPDVFGYAANIPQIIKKVGMKYFMTIKIYWNQINKPPYQTFEWEGIDGTRVLTHFAPGGDYNSVMTPEQVAKFWDAYKQQNINDTALYIFGRGDGGGGPTRQMIETAERLKNFPHMPRVEHTTVQSFFEQLEQQVAGNPILPRWVGELYLEFHRGTYTSQAKNKRFNRRSEIALQSAEQIASLAHISGIEYTYPQTQINQAWELTLLNQFHDIIPGSSIADVYLDSTKDYEAILAAAEAAKEGAMGAIAEQVDGVGGDLLIYNPLPWAREDYGVFPASFGLTGQLSIGFDGELQTLVPLNGSVSLGYSVFPKESPIPADPDGLSVTVDSLENSILKIKLDENGEIISIFDKRLGFEVVDPNAATNANALLAFEDRPMKYDAWDIDIFYQDKIYPVLALESIEVLEAGPVRATIEVKRTFGRGSTLTQRISLWPDSARIDFDTLVDWQERSALLKVAFPVNVHTPHATYDIQFGNVERPTHWNTTWDWARFEVCGHKWADLSEGGDGGYGVALPSDCKYGWDIKGHVLRLTLLKGAESPDKTADIGTHRFMYSLLPHVGNWRSAEVLRRAYELNIPVLAAVIPENASQQLPGEFSFASVDKPNLVIETVKKAEDSDALIIRLYEAHGQRGHAIMMLGHPFQEVVEVNLMEDETEDTRAADISSNGQQLSFEFSPYEIKTFKVLF